MRFKRGETVVVTGANTGIGAETAKQLAERGGKVILAARNLNQAEEVLSQIKEKGHQGYVLPLDLSDLQSIRDFARTLLQNEPELHCLVLNAAYCGPKQTTKDGFEQSIGVNHLDHMYLTYILIELLMKSAPSRVVLVSSDGHNFCRAACGHMYLTYLLIERLMKSAPSRVVVVSSDGHNFCRAGVRWDDLMYAQPGAYSALPVYFHSKLCNLLFTIELAERLSGTNVTVNAAHPGAPVESKIMRHNSVFGQFRLLAPLYKVFCREASDGAQTFIYCACSEECGRTTGKYYENLAEGQRTKAAMDRESGKKLWNISCDLLKIPQTWPRI